MGAPKMPPAPKQPNQAPNLLDPTVMFARLREKQKALQASGRASTILSSPMALTPSLKAGAGY